jgi:positive phototaxis protein PixI
MPRVSGGARRVFTGAQSAIRLLFFLLFLPGHLIMTTAPVSASSQHFLSFQLPPQSWGILPTDRLVEILNLPVEQIVPIGNLPAAVIGVCNWRGEVLWLLDLAYQLGMPPLFSQGKPRSAYTVMIVHQGAQNGAQKGSQNSTQNGTQTLGLVVEQVNQMVWCDPAAIVPLPATQFTDLQQHRLLQGYWLQSATTYLALDCDRLFAQLRPS